MSEQKTIQTLLSEMVLKAVADYEVYQSHVIVLHVSEQEAQGITNYISGKLETHCDYVGEVTANDLEFYKE